MRPLLLRLHFYAAILAAPFLLVAALSGGLYALAPQIEQVVYADELTTDSRGPALPLADQVASAREVEPTLPLLAIRPAEEVGQTTRLLFDDGRTEEFRRLAVFVDPVTAEVTGESTSYGSSGALPLRTWVGELHRHLHLGEPGRLYSELAASWLGVVVAAGLGLWLTRPGGRGRFGGRGARGYPSRETQGATRRTSPRRRTLALHSTVGLWATLGFLMLSVTGLTWSTYAGANVSELRSALSWTAPPVISETGPGSSEEAGRAGHAGHGGHGGDTAGGFIPVDSLGVGYDAALASARAEGLDGLVEVTGPTALNGTYVVSQTDSTWPTRGDVTSIDPETGSVVDTVRFDSIPLMAKAASWGIDLHMGVLFGWVSAIAMFGLALALVAMIVTGYRAWWLRRPTRGHALRMGRPVRRGAWRSLPPVGTAAVVVVALAVGWFLPVLGVSLLVFLAIDLMVGLRGSRQTA
ncbi:PepSY domain-containing protein [Nocardioidaceae bacterium]|nr:PepSY domain-containing protein [Nocardioidaceae bacterium]